MCYCKKQQQININFILERDSRELKSIECYGNKLQNEDINCCIFALIQLSGHSPKPILHQASYIMNGVVSSKAPPCNEHTKMLHTEMQVITSKEVAVTVN